MRRNPIPIPLWGSKVDRHVLALMLAMLVATCLRVVGLTRQGFWTDELYVIWEGRQPLDILLNPQIHIQHPPGYRLVLHAWMGFSVDEAWIRLVPLTAGVLLVPAVWALARLLWPGRLVAGDIAALMIATSPFLLHYSQDATTYSWTTLWVTLSFFLLVLAWRRDSVWLWVAWSVSLAISLYSHYFALFPLAAQGVGLLLMGLGRGPEKLRRTAHGSLAIAFAVVLYLPWMWQLTSSSGDALGVVFFPLTLDGQVFNWLPVLAAGYGHPLVWQYGWGGWLAWIALAALVAWGLFTLYKMREVKSTKAFLPALSWLLTATIGPYLFLRITSPPGSVDPVRFATMAAPALLLVVAAIVAMMKPVWRLPLLAAWLLLAGWQWQSELRSPPVQDWRGILTVVREQAQPGDVVLAFPAFHAAAAAAYYPPGIPVLGGWFVGEGSDATGAAYWFPSDWRWRGFLDPVAHRSIDWTGEIAARTQTAGRVWYLAGDGVDGTYPPSRAAEEGLKSVGWQPAQEWKASPLILQLYTKAAK